ncbi:MAG: serine/threonine protein kinase [Rhodanobacteraceae bacterium]|nr:serine/threonine protein kinase [Rhodanobacteraceae bacterium]
MASSVAGQSWDWPVLDFSDPAQRQFGDYELLAELGRGGMGVVYRARQRSLDREVALKFIAAGMADPLQVARFLGEARAAAKLVHPNIVPVFEVGSVGEVHYFSMPLIDGETLDARLKRQKPPRAELLALMIKVCEALDYAHRLGLLHLDLKPANILIDPRGEPLVADFGLARQMDADGGVKAQEVSGTPAYMAPEQILIEQYRLTVATDIYALGALLYRSLSGVSPHGEGASADLIRRALAGQIRPLEQAGVDRDLAAVCAVPRARSARPLRQRARAGGGPAPRGGGHRGQRAPPGLARAHPPLDPARTEARAGAGGRLRRDHPRCRKRCRAGAAVGGRAAGRGRAARARPARGRTRRPAVRPFTARRSVASRQRPASQRRSARRRSAPRAARRPGRDRVAAATPAGGSRAPGGSARRLRAGAEGCTGAGAGADAAAQCDRGDGRGLPPAGDRGAGGQGQRRCAGAGGHRRLAGGVEAGPAAARQAVAGPCVGDRSGSPAGAARIGAVLRGSDAGPVRPGRCRRAPGAGGA